jgi:hypothetical protein
VSTVEVPEQHLTISRICMPCMLQRVTYRRCQLLNVIDESVHSGGKMILPRDDRRTRINACPTTTLSTTNLAWTCMEMNPEFR